MTHPSPAASPDPSHRGAVPGAAGASSGETTVLAQVPYPPLGGSQHLTIVQTGESGREPEPRLFLLLSHLPSTVLRSAFFAGPVWLPTPLAPPLDRILLPPLRREELREERVRDGRGRVLGMLLSVPALFVHANQILLHQLQGNDRYDYRGALGAMVRESGRLMAGVLKRGLLRVRERPGVMAHAQADPRLAREEVGISQAFAREVLREVRKACPRALEGAKEREGTEEREGVEGVEALNGFPTWTVRFPLANRWGVQALRLRVLPGSGRYLALHPFTLSERFLGDVDGDLILCHLRADEVARGALAVETGLTPLPPPGPLPPLRSRLTLQGILHPEALEIEEKLRAKFQPPDLRTREQRLAAIGAADAREHVAVYTMALGWWVSRVLASLGGKERTAACRAAYELLQFFMEGCMDARKLGEDNAFGAGAASEPVPEGAGKGASGGTTATGFAAASGQPSGGNGFDSYAFMEALFGGGEIRWDELQALGLPEAAAECLEQAWALSGGDLRGACARSPVYWALVLRRERREESVLPMLQALQEQGLPPEALYDAIAGDLACLPGRILSWPEETLLAAGEPCGAGLAGEGDVFSRCDDDPFQD